MKLKYFSILFLLCASVCTVSAQSIYSALHHDDPYDIKKGVVVTEITTNVILYTASGKTEVKKEVTSFNGQNKVTSEIRYDENGKMTDRLSFMYDATGTKSLARKHEFWINAVGHIHETAYYEYDSNGFLVKVTDKDKAGKIISTTTIANDENGYPVELELINDRYADFGKETARYDLENNSVVITSIGPNGNILSSHSGKIDFSKYGINETVNENGDPIQSEGYTYVYKYDKNLNWIKQTRYKTVKDRQVKNAEFTRRIKYVKK